MHFLTSILAAAAVGSTVSAQTLLAFTQTPQAVIAGVPTDIKYAGGDGSPVTITLRQGDPNNLTTIGILTNAATNGDYVWTPDPSLVDGTDYALQITQGNQINYSQEFSLAGGLASSVFSPTSSMASMTATMSLNLTSVTTTSVASLGTGTGIPMSRNITFSSATLNPTSGSGGTTASTGGSNGVSIDGPRVGSAPISSATSVPAMTAGATMLASHLAFIVSTFAAVVCFI